MINLDGLINGLACVFFGLHPGHLFTIRVENYNRYNLNYLTAYFITTPFVFVNNHTVTFPFQYCI